MTIKIILLTLLVLSFISCDQKIKEDNKDIMIDGKKYTSILLALDSLNNDKEVYINTPTYYRYLKTANLRTEIKRINTKGDNTTSKDSLISIIDNDTLVITERFFIHGHYGFLPTINKTDTSVLIDLVEVIYVDTTDLKSVDEMMTVDVAIAYDSEIVTKYVLKDGDKKKTIYYKNKKIN
jgi:hypothetical protein